MRTTAIHSTTIMLFLNVNRKRLKIHVSVSTANDSSLSEWPTRKRNASKFDLLRDSSNELKKKQNILSWIFSLGEHNLWIPDSIRVFSYPERSYCKNAECRSVKS